MSPGTSGVTGPSADWLSRQRWFGAADRRITDITVEVSSPVAEGIDWLVVAVAFAGGGTPAHLQLFWDGQRDVADHPAVVAWLFDGVPAAQAFAGPGTTVRLLSGEQSNTSLVVTGAVEGDVIVKVLRRLTAERNPDVEVVRGLWEAGFHSVPEPLAEAHPHLDIPSLGGQGGVGDHGAGGGAVDLAVARRFLAGATDGWDLATGHGASFPAQAGELGRLTAEMHLALARAFGTTPSDTEAWAEAMGTQLRRTAGIEDAERVGERYAALAELGSGAGPGVRAHGDYHLGQVMRHQGRWLVLDFEGEPARPVAERIAPSSPLKDVAGMLRSFSYAAAVAEMPSGWEPAVRRSFLDAYRDTPGIDELVPPDHADLVLACFELDKTVYEVAYERAHRPTWVQIPLGALDRLLAS